MSPTGATDGELSQRVAELEQRVASAFAIDNRLDAIETSLSTVKPGKLREWLGTLGPYFSGAIVAVVGFFLNDAVTHALQREQLNLDYIKEMRDLIKDFDADAAQGAPAARANAVGLAMFGHHAVLPLVERLDDGDVAAVAAERGLRLAGTTDPRSCDQLAKVIADPASQYSWLVHKVAVRVIGQSVCTTVRPLLEQYERDLAAARKDGSLPAFGQRFSAPEAFDGDSAAALDDVLKRAVAILAKVPRS